MSDLDMWGAIVGFAMPPLIAVVASANWGPAWRAVTAFLACAVAGGVTAWIGGDLEGLTPVRTILFVLFAALGAYKTFWQPSGIAPAIEDATSRAPAAYRGRYERGNGSNGTHRGTQ